MTFNFLGPGLTVNVEAKVKEQIILDSSDFIVEIYETVLFVDTNNFSFQKLRIRTSRLRKNEAA